MVLRLRDKADLWTLLMPPAVWALHFLFCYVAAAVTCAKFASVNLNRPGTGQILASLEPLRLTIAVATIIALILIGISARQAWRHWGFGIEDPPHDQPTDEDRQRFLGYATLLLSGLSFVSVIFIALPAFLIQDCR
ncbi:hypothetical protein HMPREF9946_00811 [Acetobacteraceae bacterium AT-5844]|nr:hypothetical protein HMPREF9946_00811 [Acetobacteraceae bacterium AT-5844]